MTHPVPPPEVGCVSSPPRLSWQRWTASVARLSPVRVWGGGRQWPTQSSLSKMHGVSSPPSLFYRQFPQTGPFSRQPPSIRPAMFVITGDTAGESAPVSSRPYPSREPPAVSGSAQIPSSPRCLPVSHQIPPRPLQPSNPLHTSHDLPEDQPSDASVFICLLSLACARISMSTCA